MPVLPRRHLGGIQEPMLECLISPILAESFTNRNRIVCFTLPFKVLTLFGATNFQIDFNLFQIVMIFVIREILVQDIGVLAVGRNQFNVAIPLPELVFRLW